MYRVLSFFFSPNLISYTFCMYVCYGHGDDFIRDRRILIRSVETRARVHFHSHNLCVFVTSVLSSRATANAPAKMLHKIYAAYLHLWRNGCDRDVCYIPRAAFREDKSYELQINQCNRERCYVARRKNVTSIFCHKHTHNVFVKYIDMTNSWLGD